MKYALTLLGLIGTLASAATDWQRGNPKFDALEQYLFPPQAAGKAGVRTDGLVVWRDGRVLYERYANGYGADNSHLTWSASKSFANALVGLAVGDGKVKIDDSICKYLTELKGTPRCGVTLDHLLRHTSGLKWSETYEEGESPSESSVLSMLYGVGHRDMGRFAAAHEVEFAPGTRWKYSSGGTNIAMAVLQKALGEKEFEQYPWKRLFGPLGMKSVTWERDGQGVFIGSSYLYAPPRELVKFGQLFLQDGVWEGKRLLPEGWVKYSVTPTAALKNPQQPAKEKASVGASWWLNVAIPEGGIEAPFPKAPSDTFFADGHWGQSIIVVPSKRLVVVRVADDRDGKFSAARYVELLNEVAR